MDTQTQEQEIEAEIPARPGFVWSTCSKCEQEFETKDFTYQGKGGVVHLKAGICDPCYQKSISKEEKDRQMDDARKFDWKHRCPAEYADTDIARIDRRNWELGLGWLSGVVTSGTGILIGGPPRKRKTRMAWMLLKQIHFKFHMKWDAFLWSAFLGELVDAYKRSDGEVESMVSNACKIPVLFIDDLAQDVATPRTAETAKRIIEERTSNHRPTIITMNATGEQLLHKYGEFGEQIKGRLSDYFTQVIFK